MRKHWITVGLLSILVVVVSIAAVFIVKSKFSEPYLAASISIYDVVDKVHTDDFYLTVRLDTGVLEGLENDALMLRTTESVYEKAAIGAGYAGMSIKISPFHRENYLHDGILFGGSDNELIVLMLKEQNTENWLITALTTGDNKTVD